jgi:hypothetical protein
MTVDLHLERTARLVCTQREFEAWQLWNRGAGYRRVMHLLDVSFTTARDRIQRANAKLANPELVAAAIAGAFLRHHSPEPQRTRGAA